MMNDTHSIKIGRSKKADICLPKQAQTGTLSRIHAELCQRDDQSYTLRDLDSLNGTYVQIEGEWVEVKEHVIHLNDSIKLGEYVIAMRELLCLMPQEKQCVYRRNPQTGAIEKIEI